jgi:hypothetical protein
MGTINISWVLWPIIILIFNAFMWFVPLEEESFKELWKAPGSKIFNLTWPFLWPFYIIIVILGNK